MCVVNDHAKYLIKLYDPLWHVPYTNDNNDLCCVFKVYTNYAYILVR